MGDVREVRGIVVGQGLVEIKIRQEELAYRNTLVHSCSIGLISVPIAQADSLWLPVSTSMFTDINKQVEIYSDDLRRSIINRKGQHRRCKRYGALKSGRHRAIPKADS